MSFKWLILIAFASSQTNAFPQFKAGCTFNLDTSSPSNPPHLIDANNNIILPVMVGSSRTITLNTDDKVAVGCLGPGTTSKPQNAAGSCPHVLPHRNCFWWTAKSCPTLSAGCLSQNNEILLETALALMDRAPSSEWDGKRDRMAAANYFSTHIIHGKSAAADDSSNERPSFSQGGYYPGIDVNTAYSQTDKLNHRWDCWFVEFGGPVRRLPEVKSSYREDTWAPRWRFHRRWQVKTQLIIS
uniref:Uncharacterized protein n=1 Tax=Daphnia galeata TaxID=27404 RepID=A0A8J2RNT7_9CRUS|nr:unnamed protein product [Daphnia galeata]